MKIDRYYIALAAASMMFAAVPTEINLPGDKPFPESLSSTDNGTIYVGSVTKSEIFRAMKGQPAAEVWIKPGTAGLQRVLGVLADLNMPVALSSSQPQRTGLAPSPAANCTVVGRQTGEIPSSGPSSFHWMICLE
jgi:hypothetical protein